MIHFNFISSDGLASDWEYYSRGDARPTRFYVRGTVAHQSGAHGRESLPAQVARAFNAAMRLEHWKMRAKYPREISDGIPLRQIEESDDV